MPDEIDEGIILNKYPFSETSLVIHWITKNLGLISTVARGVFRQNSKFSGKIDLFYRANIEFRKSLKSDLHSLKEVDLIETHQWIRENISALHQSSYCAALIENLIEKNTPIPNIFEYFATFLNFLKFKNDSPLPLLWFETKLLIESGELNLPKKIESNPGLKSLFNALINSNTPQDLPADFNKTEIKSLINYNLYNFQFNERLLNLRKKAMDFFPLK